MQEQRVTNKMQETLRRRWKRIKIAWEQTKGWLGLEPEHRGTAPRKARVGREKTQKVETRRRASKRRAHREMTKRLQKTRMARGQNVRTGGRRA